MSDGGWTGRDPQLRLLRTAAALVMMGLLTYVIVDGQANDPTTLGTLAGSLLVVLGFEAGIRWKNGNSKSKDDSDGT